MLSSFDEDYEKSLTLWTTNSSYLAIHRISTASDLRNQGIAREIMEVIHILAKSQNIKLSIKNILDDKERIAYELKIE